MIKALEILLLAVGAFWTACGTLGILWIIAWVTQQQLWDGQSLGMPFLGGLALFPGIVLLAAGVFLARRRGARKTPAGMELPAKIHLRKAVAAASGAWTGYMLGTLLIYPPRNPAVMALILLGGLLCGLVLGLKVVSRDNGSVPREPLK